MSGISDFMNSLPSRREYEEMAEALELAADNCRDEYQAAQLYKLAADLYEKGIGMDTQKSENLRHLADIMDD